jgi:2-polyprenyl-3-methyl-5-hydroxy-6-metoxy-1,4-benzoquinol methylase
MNIKLPMSGGKERKEFPDWELKYKTEDAEKMPWYHPELDHDLAGSLSELKIESGSMLDLCTGPGTQAMVLAEMGFEVTGIDISGSAVKYADEKAKEKGLKITFLQDDFLDTKLEREFDFVFDRGCFHVLHPEEREVYVKKVLALIRPSGYLFLKIFSHKEKREEGPYRFRPEELREIFSSGFKILSIKESEFHGTMEHFPKALYAVMQKP